MMASESSTVEHVIEGMKRYRILSDHFRVQDVKLNTMIPGVCAEFRSFT